MSTPLIEQPTSARPMRLPASVAARSPWQAWLARLKWLVVASLLAVGALVVWQYGFFLGGAKVEPGALTQQAARGDLVITVTEDGNVESSSNLDVKCEVAGGSTILWLVRDGVQVNKGDELVRLDSALIEEQVNTQKIAYEKAQATRIEAERTFSAAKLAVQEYIEGTYLQQLQTCEANITIAQENLHSAENTFFYTEKMTRKGYVPTLQRDSQAFAVERAKLDLATARTAKTVLEKFTKAKTLEELESKRDTAEAKMRSEEAAFALEEGKLKRLTTQLEKCTILAPRDGMVIYANEPGAPGQQTVTIEEGAAVRERQSIIRLPDLNHMQVKALVNESKVERLRPGMRARIRVQDANYQGTVFTIANQAEPAGFFSANVKDFATIVKIDDDEIPHDGVRQLKPGMTASVEILVGVVKDVVSIKQTGRPQAGRKSILLGEAWQPAWNGASWNWGPDNMSMIEVKSGLSEGDEVLLNPKPYASDLASEFKAEKNVNIKERYGDQPAGAAAAAGPKAGGGPGGGARVAMEQGVADRAADQVAAAKGVAVAT